MLVTLVIGLALLVIAMMLLLISPKEVRLIFIGLLIFLSAVLVSGELFFIHSTLEEGIKLQLERENEMLEEQLPPAKPEQETVWPYYEA